MAILDIKTVGNLLIVSVSGKLDADEVITVINEYYPNGIVKNVIWDLTNGSLLLISQHGFRRIAKAAKESVEGGARQGGKTAYVGLADVEYGLLRMYSAIAEMTGIPINYFVFKTFEEARVWINQE
jgi:hypothetical protein